MKKEIEKQKQTNKPDLVKRALNVFDKKIDKEHISTIIDIARDIVDSSIRIAEAESQSLIRLRESRIKLNDDLQRASDAKETLAFVMDRLSDEDVSKLATDIIKVQLGVYSKVESTNRTNIFNAEFKES